MTQEGVSTNQSELEKQKKEKAAQLFGRLKTLIRTISGKPNLIVTTEIDPLTRISLSAKGQNPDDTWFNYKVGDREYVHVPERILEEEEIALGKAAHESGHSLISRTGDILPDSIAREIGFVPILMATEERPTDNVIKKRFPGAGEWIKKARRKDAEDGTLSKQSQRILGRRALFAELCDMIVQEPYVTEEERRSSHSPEAVKMFEKIRKTVGVIEEDLPQEHDSEDVIRAKAISRYSRMYREIWPKMRPLIERDIKDQQLEELLKEMLGNTPQDPSKDSSEAGTEVPPSILKDLLSKDLLKKIEQEISGKPEIKEDGKAAKLLKKLQELLKKEDASGPSAEAEKTPDAKDASQTPAQEGGELLKSLSEETKKRLEREILKLPEDVTSPSKEKATQKMKELSDALKAEMESQLSDEKVKSISEIEKSDPEESERDADETQDERDGKTESPRAPEQKDKETRDRKDSRDRKEKVSPVAEEPEDQKLHRAHYELFESVYKEVYKYDEILYTQLEEIFAPNLKSRTTSKDAGDKINLKKVIAREASLESGHNPDNRIFEVVRTPEKRDYSISILVDLSGSMGNGVIEPTLRGVVLLTEVLSRLGIDFEINGFQDEVIRYKKIDEALTDDVRTRIGNMVDEVFNKNPGGHNQANFNDDGPCLEEVADRFSREKAKNKFLIVLSDGEPSGRRSNSKDLEKAVEKIMKAGDVRLIGIGLGPGTEHVKTFYPHSIPNVRLENFCDEISKLLRNVIEHPEEYGLTTSSG